MRIEPIVERAIPGIGSSQKLYRFDNSQGASVVQGPYTYGGSEGLYEFAVLIFTGTGVCCAEGDENWELDYETPITDDVIGHLTDNEVQELLMRVRDLPGRGPIRVSAELGEQPAIEGRH